MAGHHTPQAQQAQAAAEQRLLGLHEQLWGLATELLLPEEDKAGAADRPSPPPRAPRAIIEDLKRCRAEADAVWAQWDVGGGGGKRGNAEEERAKEATRRQRAKERVAAELRSRCVGRTTEAFADELDALRRTDPTFKGNEEDVRGLIAMLEEGAALLLAEGDEGTLGVYRDHLRGEEEEEEEEEESDGDILDEPVHARVRREKGMVLVPLTGGKAAAAAAARASSFEDEGMEEGIGDESSSGDD